MLGVQIAILCLSVALAKPLLPLHQKWTGASARSDNAEERSGNFEGDMILSSKQLLDLRLRTGLINLKYRWPNKVVPYQLSENFNEEQAQYIRQSLCMIEEVSCLRFVTKNSSHSDFVSVHADPSGCSSSVGYQGGEQRLNLAPNQPGQGCFRNGTIVHEFLHALGFFHMQSASDRDNYVTIVWDNIQPQHLKNFQKYNDSVITHFGVEYDYESVMHYPRTAFSIYDLDTIIPHDPLAEIGQRVRLSSGDIERLNKMYESNQRNETMFRILRNASGVYKSFCVDTRKQVVNWKVLSILKMIVGKVLIFCALLGFVAVTARRWPNRWRRNPEEGPYFEGDMIISREQYMNLQTYNGMLHKRHRWPNATVVYKISPRFSKQQVGFVRKAIRSIERVSCVRFVEKTSHHDHFVYITSYSGGCHSNVGYNYRERQIVNLHIEVFDKDKPIGCFRHGTIVHEILHCLGFYHMQSSYDRDEYVTIMWKNIWPKHKQNFIKYSNKEVTHFGVEYDYGSIMHYSRKAFSKRRSKDTIVPRDPNARIGQRRGLSQSDIKRINKMYECKV